MTLIEASYRLITPLFCGGVTPKCAELRLPSFKGVLRFWWRALAWSRCSGNLVLIQQQEDLLFGSTSTGQARVSMRLKPHPSLVTLKKDSLLTVARDNQQLVGMGARYLGYGLMHAFPSRNNDIKAGQLIRAALQAPLDFVVQMRITGLNDELQASLQQSLIALGTLGGMGSRSRRGYGSLTLQSLTIDDQSTWTPPRSAEALAEALQSLLGQANQEGLPEFTALSRGSRLVLLSAEEDDEPLQLLDLVGSEMVRFRSWGNRGKILTDIDSEKNFEADHHLMKMKMPANNRKTHPERIAFGLPHNDVSPAGQLDRRASPLLIHIHQCGSQPVAVISFLPARFLPHAGHGNAQISVGGQKVAQKPEQELYQPIHSFLNRLLDQIPPPKNRKEPFTMALEVKP